MNLSTPKYCSRCGIRLTKDNCYYRYTNLLCKKHHHQYRNEFAKRSGWRARKKYEAWHNKTAHRREQLNAVSKRMHLKYPEKFEARAQVYYAVKKGILKRKPCKVCGKPKVEGHHKDYSKPLEVVWLCKTHHTLADKNLIKI